MDSGADRNPRLAQRPPPRILIVDDHPGVRTGLKRILQDAFDGAVLGEAANAAQALDLVRDEEWDVILLDISLPDRSGLDIMPEIKRARPNVPVLILSDHPESQFGDASMRAGATAYMTKDVAPEKMIATVRETLDNFSNGQG